MKTVRFCVWGTGAYVATDDALHSSHGRTWLSYDGKELYRLVFLSADCWREVEIHIQRSRTDPRVCYKECRSAPGNGIITNWSEQTVGGRIASGKMLVDPGHGMSWSASVHSPDGSSIRNEGSGGARGWQALASGGGPAQRTTTTTRTLAGGGRVDTETIAKQGTGGALTKIDTRVFDSHNKETARVEAVTKEHDDGSVSTSSTRRSGDVTTAVQTASGPSASGSGTQLDTAIQEVNTATGAEITVESKTTTQPDGSSQTVTTMNSSDGSKSTTLTDINAQGGIVTLFINTASDGTYTVGGTVANPDGSSSGSSTTNDAGGAQVGSSVTSGGADGSFYEETITTDAAGNTTTTTTVTHAGEGERTTETKDANGNTTSSSSERVSPPPKEEDTPPLPKEDDSPVGDGSGIEKEETGPPRPTWGVARGLLKIDDRGDDGQLDPLGDDARIARLANAGIRESLLGHTAGDPGGTDHPLDNTGAPPEIDVRLRVDPNEQWIDPNDPWPFTARMATLLITAFRATTRWPGLGLSRALAQSASARAAIAATRGGEARRIWP